MEKPHAQHAAGMPAPALVRTQDQVYGNLCYFSTHPAFDQIIVRRIRQLIASRAVFIEKFRRDSRETVMHLQKMFRMSLMMLRPCGVVVREVSVPLTENLICVPFRDVAVGLCDFLLCDRQV